MPKIVDRKKKKAELVEQAVVIFQEHGYRGLGMRQIAQELGMSKSALYHYFPSKESLFEACTEFVTQRTEPPGEAPGSPLEGVLAMALAMEGEFAGELSLLVDYLRGKTPGEIAGDPTMQLANRRYLESMTALVGEKHAKPVLCQLYGWLLLRWLDGGETKPEELAEWCGERLGEEGSEV
jgi:AcrR family transcriptional regulator